MAPQQLAVTPCPQENGSASSPRAIVLLMGWWGAELRHVKKYAELYQTRGCATVSVVADTFQVMTHLAYPSLDNCARDAASQVAQLIRDNEKNGEKIPVIVHAFSNAGSFLMDRLEVLIQQARKDLSVSACKDLILVGARLDGEVFDSSPAYPDISLGFTSTNGVVFGNLLIVKILVGILFFMAGAISVLCNWFLCLPDVRWTFWSNMREGRLCLRQAYIYSTADSITNVRRLEELIENRKRFSNVTVQRFVDSKHVTHMMKHPEVYEKVIDDFLRASTPTSKSN